VALYKIYHFWEGKSSVFYRENALIQGIWEKSMELTDEQLEIIKKSSREIDFGRITIDFTGSPSFIVDITAEKRHRFQRYKKAEPVRV